MSNISKNQYTILKMSKIPLVARGILANLVTGQNAICQ